MIIEYVDDATHPSVVAWVCTDHLARPVFTSVEGGAWPVRGGWETAWRVPFALSARKRSLRGARMHRLTGNGRRYGGHTSVTVVRVMTRSNIIALITR